MIKLQSFLVRRDDMTHEAFREYWLNEHVPLARELPGLRRYRTAVPVAPERSPYDGIAELYFETADTFEAVLGPDSDTEAIRDVDNFEKTTDRYLLEETVHRDDLEGSTRNLKLVAILKRAPGTSHEAFVTACFGEGDDAVSTSVRKYTTAVPTVPDEAAYDGVIECYFDGLASMEATMFPDGMEATPVLPFDTTDIVSVETHVVEEIVQLDTDA